MMRSIVVFFLPVVWFGVSGCQEPTTPQVVPPKVSVTRPLKQDVPEYLYYSGRTDAKESVEIRARVEGFLEEASFRDGEMVTAGDVLFVIEQEPFDTQYEAAQAQLEQAMAKEKLAVAEEARSKQLLQNKAVSVEETQQKQAEVLVAKAQVAMEEQKVRQAKLELDYTRITSPIAGQVSEKLVDVGNLVGAGENTLLTTVVQMDPIHVYFDLAESVFVQLQRVRAATSPTADRSIERIEMKLVDEDHYTQVGKLDFLENRVDPDTGTILVRAEFPNRSGLLYPGLFVRLRIPIKTSQDALLVKQTAIQTDLGGKYVLVLDNDNLVERRYVQLGSTFGDMQVVVSGLREDEQYVVKGIQRARPGLPVEPEWIDVALEDVDPEPPEETVAPSENRVEDINPPVLQAGENASDPAGVSPE